jgi:hypothetical protein
MGGSPSGGTMAGAMGGTMGAGSMGGAGYTMAGSMGGMGAPSGGSISMGGGMGGSINMGGAGTGGSFNMGGTAASTTRPAGPGQGLMPRGRTKVRPHLTTHTVRSCSLVWMCARHRSGAASMYCQHHRSAHRATNVHPALSAVHAVSGGVSLPHMYTRAANVWDLSSSPPPRAVFCPRANA